MPSVIFAGFPGCLRKAKGVPRGERTAHTAGTLQVLGARSRDSPFRIFPVILPYRCWNGTSNVTRLPVGTEPLRADILDFPWGLGRRTDYPSIELHGYLDSEQ